MPRITNVPGPYWFYFYSFDCNERIHVHVRRESKTCKFWLRPVELAANYRFVPRELNEIRRLIEQHRERIREAWNEHCGNDRIEN
jgi:hypothetical protein